VTRTGDSAQSPLNGTLTLVFDIGGGNSRLIESTLPNNLKTASNEDGITGGVKVRGKQMDQSFTETSSAFVTVPLSIREERRR
jgi:hypothetical protein